MHILSQLSTMLLCVLTIVLVFVLAVFFWECRILGVFFYCRAKQRSTQILYKPSSIVIHILFLTVLLSLIYSYSIEPYWVQVKTVPIYTNKLHSAVFHIVQISDLHCDKKMRAEKYIVDHIRQIKPDIIVFTGDTLRHSEGLTLFQNTLRALEAPLGKYAVTGNWDENSWHMYDLFANTGFKRLTCDTTTVSKGSEFIQIAGMDYYQTLDKCSCLKELDPDRYTVFLYHNADKVDEGDKLPIDLYISGHSHGGQVALPFYGAIVVLSRHGKQYESGLYDMGHYQLYVNRGIGMEGGTVPPVRFFARPEITVFEIQPAAN